MKKTVPVLIALAAAVTALTGVVSSTASADDGLAADCAIIKPIASSVVGRLTPLQNQPVDQATAARDAYVGELRGQASSLSSSQGRADLDALATSVANLTSAADAQNVFNAIGQIQSDCA